MTTHPNYLLRGVLALFGLVAVALGINTGLGGIQTLGCQGGAVPFFTVTDAAVFALRDSNARFLGGVWLGLGLLMLAGSVALQQLRPVLVALTAMIVVGGLARLSGNLGVLATLETLPSFIFEIALTPLLGWWIATAERQLVPSLSAAISSR